MLLFLKINHIKTGAPIKDVTIPTGISDGDITVRATASATSKNIPPIIMLPGMEYLWSEPSKSFEMFGTISPAKEIIPAIETAEADNNEAAIIEKYCSLFVFKPKDIANSFPNDKTLYSFENKTVKASPEMIMGTVETNSIQPLPDRPPLNQ